MAWKPSQPLSVPAVYLLGLLLASMGVPALAGTFFVDCSQPRNGTGTQAAPFNRLASLTGVVFAPGDQLLFRASTVCVGTLAPLGSGTLQQPITMGRYGRGPQPVLDGKGARGAVLLLRNVANWHITDLEIRNDASAPATRNGVLALNDSGTMLGHLVFQRLTINRVRGWPGGWYSTNAGIGIQTNHTVPESTWNDIQIRDSVFHLVDRIAIAVTPDHDGEGTGRTQNLVIRGNRIDHSGGDDILVVKGSGALIENNMTQAGGALSAAVCPPTGEYCNRASASIWVAGSDHTIIRGNAVRCFINELDGQAFDVDWGDQQTLLEENYSTENRGGFLLLMPAIHVRGEPTSAVPSSGTVIRNNVSDRDTLTESCLLKPRRAGPAAILHLTGDIPSKSDQPGTGPVFDHNTIYLPQGATADIIGSRAGPIVHGTLTFSNNIVLNGGSGSYVSMQNPLYQGNLFSDQGSRARTPGRNNRFADPLFVGPLPSAASRTSGTAPFRLLPRSPALHAAALGGAQPDPDTRTPTGADVSRFRPYLSHF